MPKRDTGVMTGEPITYEVPSPAGGVQLETFIPWKLVKRGVKREIITPIDAPEQFQEEAAEERLAREKAKDTPLMRALGLAHYWQKLLDEGKVQSISDIAQQENIDVTQVRRLLRLVLLAPSVIEALIANKEPTAINLEFILRQGIPADWQAQAALFTSPH